LLDGAMTNCLFAQGIEAMTAELRVRYRFPVLAAEPLTVRAWQEPGRHGLLELRSEVTQAGTVKARAQARFIATPDRAPPG
jgi:acyl-CoA thioesterase FadM